MYLDIDTFQTLAAIVEEGSFAKAAERLGQSQSAVSYKIKQLERFLGAPVFDRSAYRAVLTDSGHVIYREGKKLLQQMLHIETLAQRYRSGWELRLDVVMDGALPMEPMLKALKILEQEQLATVIQLHIEHLAGVQRRFEQTTAAIMLTKEFALSPELSTAPLPPIINLLVTSEEHPLSTMKAVSRAQLQTFVELTVNDSLQQAQSDYFSGTPMFGGERVYFLGNFQQKRKALLTGLGFGWMPSYMIEKELASGQLVTVDYHGDHKFQFTPQLAWRRSHEQSPVTRRLLGLLLEEYQYS